MNKANKVLLLVGGGSQAGYEVGKKSLVAIMQKWDIDLMVMDNPSLDSALTFVDISQKYKEGYKIVSVFKAFNEICSSIVGTNVVDPKKPKDGDVFSNQYLNKKPLKVYYPSDNIDFEFLPMYHPLFVLENERQMFTSTYISRIRSYLDIPPREKFKVCKSAYNYKELYDWFIAEHQKAKDSGKPVKMSYDIETNFEFSLSINLKIVGFSLSFDGNEGVYVVLESLESSFSDEEKKKAFDLLKWSFNSVDRIVVHNLMFETPCTLNRLGYELPIKKLDDTLVWSKLLNCGRTGGNSLKAQAVLRLGYSDWSDVKDEYQKAFGELVGFVRKLKESGKLDQNGTRFAIFKNFRDSTNPYFTPESSTKFFYDEMRRVLSIYYNEDEIEGIVNLAFERLEFLADTPSIHAYSYEHLPSRLVSVYGALDSIATRELLDFFEENAVEENKIYNIQLEKGYKLWMQSHYAGYLLELNSASWDKEQSEVDEKICESIIATDTRTLLKSDKTAMRDYISNAIRYSAIENFFKEKSDWIKSKIESHPKFLGYTGTGRIRYEDKDGKTKNIMPQKYDQILEVFEISSNALFVYHKEYLENFINNEIDKMSYRELRDFLNPNTTDGKEVIKELMFNDYLLGAKFISDVHTYQTTETFQVDKANKSFSDNEMNLLNRIAEFDKNAKPEIMKSLFSDVMNMLNEINLGRILSRFIVNAGSYRPTTVDEGNMTDLFELQKITGIDPEGDIHNGDEYSNLFATRRMKKTMKILDTYLNGNKLGRGTLMVVPKDILESGAKFVPRLRDYKGEELGENEVLIAQSAWNPNGVMSGRWSGGIHTLPSSGDPKRWFKSRFRGGCVMLSDYCLTGDTRIPLMDGSEPTIAELVDRDEFFVYSYDEDSKRIVAGRGHSARVIRKSFKNLKLTLDNGAEIECTPEHKFYDYDAEIMREAQEYKVGDSLLPIRFSTQSGYRAVHHPYSNNKERTYYLGDKYNIENSIYEDTDNCDIHHIDKDRDDDSPTNLERVPSSDHKRAHRMMNWCDSEYRGNIIASAKSQWRGNREKMIEYARKGGKAWAQKFNSREDAGDLKSIGLKASIKRNLMRAIALAQSNGVKVSRLNWDNFIDEQELIGKGYKLRGVYGQYQTFQNFLDEMRSKNYISDYFYEECSFMDKLYEKAVSVNQAKVSLIHRTRLIYEVIEESRLEFNELNWNIFRDRVGLGVYQRPKWDSVVEFFGDVDNITRAFKRNHKIVNIEEITYDEGIDTYCLTVDKYHNFFLSAGVLSSNSQAEIRVVAKAANDINLLTAYENGIDVHLKTACSIFDRTPETITETERRYSKMGCHVGSTLIKVSEDESITIEEMYNNREEFRYEVLSYDIRNRRPIITEPINIQMTKLATELTKLTFSNGTTWEGTPDHPFLTRTGLYVRADKSKDMKLMSVGKEILEVVDCETYSCKPTPVYDLSIPKYHNYCLDLGSESGVFVHNTFNILYGGTPNGFGVSFLNGDVATAQRIFDGFFETYPQIKEWMEARHKEIKEKGVVTLLTNRYVKLGFEGPTRALDKIIRQSGNVPIQGASSDIAASSLFNLCNFLQENNRKSKPFAFIHDSIEVDTHPDDLFYMIEQFVIQMNQYPRQEFQVSTKAGVSLGFSLDEEVEVEESIPDEDYRGGLIELKGAGDCVDRLIAQWADYFDEVEVELIKETPKYNTWREIFQVKRSYYKNMGHIVPIKHVKVRLRIGEGKGCSKYSKEGLVPLGYYDKFLDISQVDDSMKYLTRKMYMDPESEIYKVGRED